jgi:hypothetical protein
MTLAAIVVVLIQAAIGMDANLYVTVPSHHAGAHPSDFLTGSVRSVAWAIGHGSLALAIHAALGLLLVLMVLGNVVRAGRAGRRALLAWSTLGALLVIAAGFNGAAFLDYDKNANSLIMALLSFAAVIAYALALFTLSGE